MKSKKNSDRQAYILLAVTAVIFGIPAKIMGTGNLFNTIMNTAHDLLLNTVFYIMAISVVTGALSSLMAEFGVISLLNRLMRPLMRPLYGLPGAASLGILSTFVSDNPAILSLAKNDSFIKYFKEYQVPALCNLGTSFGMGMILASYMIGLGVPGTIGAVFTGVAGAVVGSLVSVALMLRKTAKYYNIDKASLKKERSHRADTGFESEEPAARGSVAERALNSILEGGKTGVSLGMDIIPGVLCICTFVMILTFGAPADGVYTGAAYEGIALLPKIGRLISPLTKVLFGFSSPSAIAFPITSLGATGAAMALVPQMIATGAAGANEIAVFTAMGMCWSGYLSTHISMMDALGKRQFIKDAIISHTIGGLAAGVAAHYIWVVVSLL